MKKICFLCFLCVYTFCSAQQISKNVDSLVYNYIKDMNIPDFWLYRLDKVVPENTNISMIKGGIQSPPYDVYCYFIDEEPNANWEHKCRYVFINASTHSIITVQSKTPPNNLEKWVFLSEIKPQITGKLFDFSNNKSMKVVAASSTSTSGSNKYAVIISGGSDSYNNWSRYWNDCSAMYKALKNIYGYTDDHIYVLMSDGISSGADRHVSGNIYDSSPLDLDNDGVNDIKYSATKSNIDIVFNELSSKLTSNDCLFVFTTDHGGYENGDDVYMYLWGETMRDDEFAQEVNKVNAGVINIVMEQCYSGGFIADLAKNNRTVATACTAAQTSFSTSDNLYNEFVFRWISAVCGSTPDGMVVNADSNLDGKVSMQEAFLYAQSHDTKTETPQYSSTPSLLGQQVSLFWATISGSSQVCDQATYTIDNSAGATVVWSATPTGVVSLQPSGSSVTLTKVGSGLITLSATINNSFTVTKDVWVGNETAMIGVFDLKTGNMLGAPYNNSQQYNIRVLLNNAPASSSSYRWEVTSLFEDDNIMIYRGPSFIFGAGSSEGYYHFTLKYLLECGWSTVSKDIYFGNRIYSFSLYPNPATNVVTLQLIKEETLEIVNQASVVSTEFDVQQVGTVREGSPKPIVSTSDYEVQFWNEYSGLVHSVKSNELNLQISLKSLPKGMYFVHFIKKGEKTKKQILWVK